MSIRVHEWAIGVCSLLLLILSTAATAAGLPQLNGTVAAGVQPAPASQPAFPSTRPATVARRADSPPSTGRRAVLQHRDAVMAARPTDPYARFGFDISWPQCTGSGAALPPPIGSLAIVGVNDGRPFTSNPCLATEWRWARSRVHAAAYLNLAAPATGDPRQYGAATAADALTRAAAAGAAVRMVWLDVEIGNHWTTSGLVNVAVIDGAVSALQRAHVAVGVYSSQLDWLRITGGATVDIPEWLAIPDGRKIVQSCGQGGFGGRAPDLVQAVFSAPDGHLVDGDLSCSAAAE